MVCATVFHTDTIIADSTIELTHSYPPFDNYYINKGDTLITTNDKCQKCGFIDRTGKEVFQLEYTMQLDTVMMVNPDPPYEDYEQVLALSYEMDFNDGFEILKKGDLYGIADTSGKIIFPFEFAEISVCYPDQNAGHSFYVMNKGGVQMMDEEYFVMKTVGGKWALYDMQLDQISDFIYDFIGLDEEGTRIIFTRGDIHGYIDIDGKEVLK
jgi:hypothetical protein